VLTVVSLGVPTRVNAAAADTALAVDRVTLS